MKISEATAKSAIAGNVPADMEEYARVGDVCAGGGSAMTAGRAGVFLAFGRRLAASGYGGGEVDLTPYAGTVSPDEASGALVGVP
jgi:hypothetical protein